MAFTTLITTGQLAARLGDAALVVVDCRFSLDDEASGERQYAAAHIPGAVYVHLDRDLSGPRTGRNGRHPLPDPSTLAHTFGRLGVAGGTQVAAYDQDSGMFASRLWWLLRWLGHDAAAVLDGGFAKWVAEGRQEAGGQERCEAREFQGVLRAEMAVGVAEVMSRLGNSRWRLMDARSPERFRGELETLDRVAGHIPGAINQFFQWNLDERGTFRPPEDLAARFRAAIGSIEPAHIICYCGSGVTACHNLLAMEHGGIAGARLYAGSWSEWSSDTSRPIEPEKAG